MITCAMTDKIRSKIIEAFALSHWLAFELNKYDKVDAVPVGRSLVALRVLIQIILEQFPDDDTFIFHRIKDPSILEKHLLIR